MSVTTSTSTPSKRYERSSLLDIIKHNICTLQVVIPVAKAYNPDLILVSCGFDAAWGDPLGGMAITARGYMQMTQMLTEVGNGKVVLALEGKRALLHSFHSHLTATGYQAVTTCESLLRAQRRV